MGTRGDRRLLIVHHSPTPNTLTLLNRVVSGAGAEGLESVEVVVRPALAATAEDVAAADGYVLGTPANLGYMSGALKHFFDTIYEPCLQRTRGRPYGLYVHGRSDTDGARLSVEKITTGLGWRLAHSPVSCLGPVEMTDEVRCWGLGAALGALLTLG